jgi:glycosyltransferase involved in cell wall biosynthesis
MGVSMKSMKIGIVMPVAIQIGGGEKMLTDLLEYGRGQSVEWTVIFLEDGPMIKQVESWGIAAHIIHAGRLREIHRLGATVLKIAKIARHQNFDMLIGWMPKAHIYSGLAAKLVGIPSLWYDLERPNKSGRLRQLINSIPAYGVINLSRSSYELQQKLFPDIKTCLVYPGVDIERFNPSQLPSVKDIRIKLGLPLDVPIVGIVGRMQRWKGIHTLVQSMAKLHQHYPNLHCVIVGGEFELEKEYFSYLKQLAKDSEFSTQIIFAGQQTEIPEWTQAMDIVVHASSNEPFGIVVIEGMALGKPMVAGAEGGPTEIITPDVNGLLASYEDVDGLCESISRYLEDPEFTHRVGQAAMMRANDFSVQNYADNFIRGVKNMVFPRVSHKDLVLVKNS